ncbi:hypothetical protein L204_105408 [Cryptococcus depauperatus]|nr:DASH complex subunit DAD1 [Cryptococcus depauperatus CBS 7855]
MSLSRPSNAYDFAAPSESFFEREKERLVQEISANFEELMGNMNSLNRTLEEAHGLGKEFVSVASLWGRFNELIKEQQTELAASAEAGVPGTGGANFASSNTTTPK